MRLGRQPLETWVLLGNHQTGDDGCRRVGQDARWCSHKSPTGRSHGRERFKTEESEGESGVRSVRTR